MMVRRSKFSISEMRSLIALRPRSGIFRHYHSVLYHVLKDFLLAVFALGFLRLRRRSRSRDELDLSLYSGFRSFKLGR